MVPKRKALSMREPTFSTNLGATPKFQGARRVTFSKLYAEDPEILGAVL